eukprot:CAMPEP_0185212904 /NCGR_PEP_ID=MMETSP1140-20130426/67765_1 /TAXON_ID=298111 /ORGANISM="Pavlova sp., Strain CCMP459" /LENGTH=95 /DNA_ID=CAMNT_0027780763 /DNA_START=438 /DNA_END=725 /DNA_ORIENTATION=-
MPPKGKGGCALLVSHRHLLEDAHTPTLVAIATLKRLQSGCEIGTGLEAKDAEAMIGPARFALSQVAVEDGKDRRSWVAFRLEDFAYLDARACAHV